MKRLFLFMISAVLFAMFSDRLPASGYPTEYIDHMYGGPATLSKDKDGVVHYRYKLPNGEIHDEPVPPGIKAILVPQINKSHGHVVTPEEERAELAKVPAGFTFAGGWRDKNDVQHYTLVDKTGVWHDAPIDRNGVLHVDPAPLHSTAKKVQAESKPSATPKPSKVKPTESPSDSFAKLATRFDGTWVATNYKSIPAGGKINGIYTIVIKDGKTAAKTFDTTNVSSSESADNEIHRKWTCSSTDLSATSSSLTIQWSAGELSDWAPRTISREEIQSYGSPNAETSVYQLKGDQLTRINDPNGVTYQRLK